jgi:hypothetical protein
MNGNRILNELATSGEGFIWQGPWLTATAYTLNDLASENGSTYICTESHTSGTFATDLAASKWELLASKGASGGGSGDLVAANNLSDVANTTTARANLGLVIGTDVQAYDSDLAAIAALSPAQGDILYRNGSAWVLLSAGTSGQFLKTQGAAANPVWATPSAGVFSASYDSGDLTITLAGSHTLTHSLEAKPKFVMLIAKCINAGGDAGYAQNEEIILATNGADAGGSNYGVSVRITATQIILRVGGGAGNTFTNYPHAATGVANGLDHTKWALIVRAYA